jgi:hypothetical protein
MGFLNPALLLLGLAAAVPILLHLLQRHQGPRVIFPALRYLRRAERESARNIRLRQLLLMLLRVAALLLLALAASRPYTRLGGAAHLPTAVAIVLDNSMSSGAVVGEERVIDMLRERALETLALAGPGDRFWLVRAGAPWEPALVGDADETAARVRETEPAATAADVPAAIAHARSLLAAGAEGRAQEIQLLTDLQATAFPTAAASGVAPLIVWAPPGAAPPNTAVTGLQIGGGLATVTGERTTVVAAIGGSGSEPVGVRLAVDGRVIGAATAAPGEAAVLTLPARGLGLTEGFVEIDADPLRADNRRHFALRVVPPLGVAVSAPAEFLENALAVLEGGRRLRTVPLQTAEIAILPAAIGLESLAPQRTAAVLPPEDALELPAVNRRLAAAGIPWQYEAPVSTGEARLRPTAADPLLGPLEQAWVRTHFPLLATGAGADSVLIEMQDGTPWAVRGVRAEGGAYVLLASPMNETATTLPTTPALLPLLDRMLGSWLAPAAIGAESRPGQRHVLPGAADSVHRADGVIEPLDQASSYTFTGEPGSYRFFAGDTLLQAVAVNPPAAASDLRRLAPRQARAALGGAARITDSPGGWARAVFHARLGHELWRPLLLAALLLLLVEAAVAASGRRSKGVVTTD